MLSMVYNENIINLILISPWGSSSTILSYTIRFIYKTMSLSGVQISFKKRKWYKRNNFLKTQVFRCTLCSPLILFDYKTIYSYRHLCFVYICHPRSYVDDFCMYRFFYNTCTITRIIDISIPKVSLINRIH